MEAAIAKILSNDVDIDDAEKLDFTEGGTGASSEAGSESDAGSGEESQDNGDASSSGEEEEDEEDEDMDDIDEGLDGMLPGGREDPDSSDGGEGSSGDELDVAGGSGQRQSFLEGGKGETFARAFARIVDGEAPRGTSAEAPILAGSKSVAKRQAEDATAAKADRAAKRLRQEMRQRGHEVPTRKGADPQADAREKTLQRTATRGVVQLFNAVAAAQRRLKDAAGTTGNRAKAAKLGKASFLAEMRHARGVGGGSESLVPSSKGKASAAAAAGGAGDGSDGEGGAAAWDVLREGFTGLPGGSKMKDWDRVQEEEEGGEGGSSAGEGSEESGSEDGGSGW